MIQHFLPMLAALLLHIASCSAAPTVTITNGTIIGVEDAASATQQFLGIPFAEPPINDYRLRQAIPPTKPFGTLQANAFGASCYQKGRDDVSEDCLTLNIWRPSTASTSNATLPVMVWLYGGGLTSGATADPTFEGTAITRISKEIGKPIILVTVNYRLGPFGFLSGKEMAELGLLNMGMLDQRLAFRWIQENIAAFGGDPRKVTLAGESAGAVSIYSHMMAYGGRNDNLFRGAILQSGGAFPLTAPNTTAFQSTFDSLISKTNCSALKNTTAEEKLGCVRKLPVDVFRAAVGPSTGQSVDGEIFRTSIQRALPAGEYIKVPTIVGANTDEGTQSAPTGMNTTSQLSIEVSKGFFRPVPLPNDTVSTLISKYTTNPALGCPYNTGNFRFSSGSLDKMACSIFGDLVQIAPARMIARTMAKDGVPMYRYRFNHLQSNVTSFSKGIGTGVEQRYVFSNLIPQQPWDQNLAYQMSSAWISFTHDLDPNVEGNGLPGWPAYGDAANSIVFNGYGSSIEQDTYRSEGMEYLIDEVLPYGAA